MATAAITNTFVAGTAAEAAQVNTNFTDLVTFLNNSAVHRDGSKAMSANFDAGSNKIVNLTAGTSGTDAVNKTQMDAAVAAAVADLDLGAWTSYTPVLDQGVNFNIAHTVNYSKYVKNGRTVTWNFDVSMTAAGATGALVVYPPRQAASTHAWIGTGSVVDASGNTWVGFWGSRNGSSSYVALRPGGGYLDDWGVTPLLTLAVGDRVVGSITYEAAS